MDFTYLLLQFLVHIKYSLYRADDVGCTTLTNSCSIWCMFGTAWTTPTLTLQLMSCVAVFNIVRFIGVHLC